LFFFPASDGKEYWAEVSAQGGTGEDYIIKEEKKKAAAISGNASARI
jgi:hypothetical protein